MQVLLVGIAGAIGVIGRYLIDQFFETQGPGPFPISTFLINSVGSFLMGVVFIFWTESGVVSKDLSVILSVGFLGGFTTLSAFSLQSFLMFERGHMGLAAAYFVGTPILGLTAAAAGAVLTRSILGGSS